MGVGGQHTDRDAIARELATPGLPAERLAQIAAAHTEFHPAIAAHPNAYPGLIDWIAAQTPVQLQAPAQTMVRDQADAPAQPTGTSAGVAPLPAPPGLSPAASPASGASEAPPQAEAPAPKLDRAAKIGTLFAGIGIGVLVGAAVSALLLLWVLPGLFGSVLG